MDISTGWVLRDIKWAYHKSYKQEQKRLEQEVDFGIGSHVSKKWTGLKVQSTESWDSSFKTLFGRKTSKCFIWLYDKDVLIKNKLNSIMCTPSTHWGWTFTVLENSMGFAGSKFSPKQGRIGYNLTKSAQNQSKINVGVISKSSWSSSILTTNKNNN